MSWLRRGRAQADDEQAAGADLEPDAAAEAEADGESDAVEDEGTRAAASRTGGPLDVAEVGDSLPRIDLGALRVPAVPGMELRLELEESTRRVVAVTVAMGGSTAQVQVFAAPRTEGIWDQVREEIGASVERQGGAAEELEGPFGTELLARMPVRTADGRTGHRPSRFVGVDGPRWFLRAVLGGPAAVDPEAAQPLEQLVRGCVVVRGAEAMPPRELLVLKLPPPPPGQPGEPGEPGQPGAPGEQGPEGSAGGGQGAPLLPSADPEGRV